MTAPLRITLLGPVAPYRGGIAHFNAALTRALRAEGHAVRLLTFKRQYPALLFPGASEYEPGPAPDDIEAERVLDSLNPLSWKRAVQRVVQGGADLAVFPYWLSFFSPMWGTAARGLRREGVRTVGLVHNVRSHEGRIGERGLARYALGACDGLLVLSDRVRKDVEALDLGLPIRQAAHPSYSQFGALVPRGRARAALGLPPEAPLLLFFGFIRRYKGLHVLLEAMPLILKSLPTARLVVAGEFYADEAALRARVANLGLSEAVRFDAEYVPQDRVGAYFGAADLVVQPYVSATQSGVAQVAFHFGRPVLTTDVGGLAETVPDGEAGLVVPTEDPGALARAAVRFFRENLAERLEAGARRQQEAHAWDPLLAAFYALARGYPGAEPDQAVSRGQHAGP